jgi:hypothetical protein
VEDVCRILPCEREGVCYHLIVLSFIFAVHISYTGRRQSYVGQQPFAPGRFAAHHSPKKTPQCSVQRRTSNQMLRHIMQAYKPKQGVCEAVFYVSGPPS